MRPHQIMLPFALLFSFQFALAQEHADKASPDPVTAEIGKNALAFVEAFNTGNSAAIAQMFTVDGEMSVDGQSVAKGHKQIEDQYAAFFKENPRAVISVHVESVRKLGPNTVIEKGISEIVNDDDDTIVDSYTAIHTKQGANWLTLSTDVRQQAVDPDFEWKEELGGMVGTWEAETDNWRVTTTVNWAADGNFLKREFKRFEGDDLNSSGVSVIGWDPAASSIRSWMFTSDGGHGHGIWSRDGNKWIVESEAVTPDGDVVHSTNIFTMLNKDEFRWQSVNRSFADVALENTDSIRIKRVK